MRRLQVFTALLVPLSLFAYLWWGQVMGLPLVALGIIVLGFKSRNLSKCLHCGANSYRPYPGGLLDKWHVLIFWSACARNYDDPVESAD